MTTLQPDACVAVFERQAYWAPELKRQFIGRRILVRDCRTIDDLLPSVSEFSSALILMVLDDAPAGCLEWLERRFSGGCCGFLHSSSHRQYTQMWNG